MAMKTIDDFFDDLMGLSVMDKPLLGNLGMNQIPMNFMRTDIVEKDGEYNLTVDLPGFKKEDIKIDLEDNVLTITAESSSEKEEKEEGKYIRRERYSGKQMRRMYVPEGTKEEDIKAAFDNGVLKISVPKIEAPKPEKKNITIN